MAPNTLDTFEVLTPSGNTFYRLTLQVLADGQEVRPTDWATRRLMADRANPARARSGAAGQGDNDSIGRDRQRQDGEPSDQKCVLPVTGQFKRSRRDTVQVHGKLVPGWVVNHVSG